MAVWRDTVRKPSILPAPENQFSLLAVAVVKMDGTRILSRENPPSYNKWSPYAWMKKIE